MNPGRPPFWLGTLIVCCLLARGAVAQSPLAGWIVQVTPPAFLDPGTNPLNSVRLGSSDLYRPVNAGDRVRCEPGGSIELALLWNGTRRITNETFQVKDPVRPTNAPKAVVEALQRFGRAGRTRADGDQPLIRFPVDRSRLRVRDLSCVRWDATRSPAELTLQLTDDTGRVLWRKRGVNASLGECSETAMLEVLTNHWKLARTDLGVELRTTAGQLLARSRFSLMPAEDERELEAGLAWWDERSTGIVRSLGRAALYSSRNLHAPAAEELDLALATPEGAGSVNLLREAIQAHDLAGQIDLRNRWKSKLENLER